MRKIGNCSPLSSRRLVSLSKGWGYKSRRRVGEYRTLFGLGRKYGNIKAMYRTNWWESGFTARIYSTVMEITMPTISFAAWMRTSTTRYCAEWFTRLLTEENDPVITGPSACCYSGCSGACRPAITRSIASSWLPSLENLSSSEKC